MAKTVVTLFDDLSVARKAAKDLENAGFRDEDVYLVQGEEAGRYLKAMERKEQQPQKGGALTKVWQMLESLVGTGATRRDVERYTEGVRRGGTLVLVTADEKDVDRAVDILERYNPVDIEERVGTWRTAGWVETYGEEAEPTTVLGEERVREPYVAHEAARGETRIPVVEEELTVGKRPVEHGDVRIHKRVEEKPVSEDVHLREEHVRVDRRRTEPRPVREGEEAFQERTYEFTERGEEPVVGKRAKVVEEVVVGKETGERVETVKDKVRRTEVDVERAAEGRTSPGLFKETTISAADREDFRNHYRQHLAQGGRSFEEFEPAYILGYSLARDERYRDREWKDIESEAQRRWNAEHKGDWRTFKDAVQHGWNRAPVLV